jgi:hypothetical protein
MRKIKFLIACAGLFFISMAGHTQANGNKADMADAMRSNGRIYVVVAVVVVILIGLIMYVVRLDKKITRMERETDIKK